MTLKDAILKSLEDIQGISNYQTVLNHILENNYYDFKKAKTPGPTVSALLGDFIRNGDTRVRRIKMEGGSYGYYLTKNENRIEIVNLLNKFDNSLVEPKIAKTNKTYSERDLHMLLSSLLKTKGTFSKTIFHEQSNGRESNQIWTHPDMVGIEFINLKSNVSLNLLKSINRVEMFKLSAYELKREINNDGELKKAYFQAVSNSSWANYGYLVAFECSDSLREEMARLNQSFGIGIIELDANPFLSKVLFPATYRELDFTTIDKLCKMNADFEKFIEQTEKIMSANDKYIKGAQKELEDFCDDYFESDFEVEAYCKQKNIPLEDN
jgi:hypothetical protein